MIPSTIHALRDEPHSKGGLISKTSVSEKKKVEKEKYIRCNQCLQPVAKSSSRISINGSHVHTFANPSGYIYEIGCFHTVIGCGYLGPASDEFTWFKGYRWKIAYCERCHAHLGWLFISSGEAFSFNGLILDKLTDPK